MDVPTINAFDQSLSKLKTLPNSIKAIVTERNNFINQINKNLNDVKGELGTLKNLVSALKSKKDALEKQVASNQTDIKTKEEDVKTNNQEVARLNAELAKYKNELQKQKQDLENKTNQSQKQIDEKESQIRNLNDQILQKEQKIKQLETLSQNANNASQTNNELVANQKKALEEAEDRCNAKIVVEQKKISDCEAKIKQLEGQINQKETDIQNFQKQRTAQAQEGEKNQAAINLETNRLKQENANLVKEIGDLKQINEQYKNKIQAATKIINDIVGEFENVKNEKADPDPTSITTSINNISVQIKELSQLLSPSNVPGPGPPSQRTYAQATTTSANTNTTTSANTNTIIVEQQGVKMTKSNLMAKLKNLIGNNSTANQRRLFGVYNQIKSLENGPSIAAILNRNQITLASINQTSPSKGGKRHNSKSKKGGFIYTKKRHSSSSNSSSSSSSNYKTRNRRGRGYKHHTKKNRKYRGNKR